MEVLGVVRGYKVLHFFSTSLSHEKRQVVQTIFQKSWRLRPIEGPKSEIYLASKNMYKLSALLGHCVGKYKHFLQSFSVLLMAHCRGVISIPHDFISMQVRSVYNLLGQQQPRETKLPCLF